MKIFCQFSMTERMDRYVEVPIPPFVGMSIALAPNGDKLVRVVNVSVDEQTQSIVCVCVPNGSV